MLGREMEHDNTYALIVKGRSMIEDHICDGDYVVIKPQDYLQQWRYRCRCPFSAGK